MSMTKSRDVDKWEEDGEWLKELQSVLHHYCLSLTKSSWDAEDLAQEALSKAWGKYIRGHANPEALLLRIAKNTWIDQLRRNQLLEQIMEKQRSQLVAMPDYGSIEIEMVLQALVEHMTSLQRTVFLLRDIFDYSNAETAEILGSTEGAIKAALHRARLSLDAVKDNLEQGGRSLPEDEEMKAYLRAFAMAYLTGDVAALVQLSMQDEVDSVVIIGSGKDMQNNVSSYSLTQPFANNQLDMRMTA